MLAAGDPAAGDPAADPPAVVDVAVVGAGAAGLLAAACAAGRGRRVALLEKNRRPGLKVLISGGGRCNLTTTLAGARLEQQYGTERGRWLRHALRSFPPAALCALVESLGVPLQEEDLDKIFPVSGRAQDVLDAVVRHAVEQGAQLCLGAPVVQVARESTGGFVVQTARGACRAASVVLATGGLSYPKTGATGDGYGFAAALGHGLVEPVPALAPLRVDAPWLTALQGVVLDAELTLLGPDRRPLVTRRRPTLITHKGLSGPAPMDVSGHVEEHHGGCTLRLDLAPDCPPEALDAELVDGARSEGRRLVQHRLPRELPERLRVALCAQAGVAELTLAALRKDARRRLVELVKGLELRVDASLGFGAAEVTRGGIPLAEVDARTMASKRTPGLFLCGELLDVDGPIGGFNFQAAFATGRLAGLHA
ncbi:MAG: aminoacetone oxidase family FAD-binding enzyme [Planctomycetes bacterium]|nr:aminoacetone oxidase family FAD-binding enzyme [Planctomycetota bacterium]